MHDVSFVIALIIALGLAAQWLAWRIRLPAIVLLSLAGLLAGPVLGWIQPRDDFGASLRPVIGLCVAIILFEGGLSLRFHELRDTAAGVRRLVYLGAPLAMLFGALAAHFAGGLAWPVALVFGAITVVTGPTVIMPMLRHAMLQRRTAAYLKWEAIINDPIGALLAVLTFQYFIYSGEGAFGDAIERLARAVLAGGLLGTLPGWLLGKAFARGHVPDWLQPPATLALVLAVYAGANAVEHEAGLLAVTVLGIVMGNLPLPGIQEMRRFKEHITVLLVSAVFVVLTADLDRAVIARIDWQLAVLIAVIMFLVRPATVWLATAGAGVDWRERLLLGWIAPRGVVAAAVAGVFGPSLVAAGYRDGDLLMPVVFLLVFATVLAHGFTLAPLARRLGLAARKRNRILLAGASRWSIELARALQALNIGVLLVDASWHRLREARFAGVPVYYGELLSENAEQSLELHDVGTLLALTGNNAYNALVCTAFANELDRRNIFQLPLYTRKEDHTRAMSRSVRGQIAFDDAAWYDNLLALLDTGWRFHRTTLTESYGWNEFRAESADGTMTILRVTAEGDIEVHTPQRPFTAQAGDTVVSFGPEKSPSLERVLKTDTEE